MLLMVSLSSRISPFTSTVIFLERSPLATAVVTSAMLRTWAVRFPAIEFTLSVKSFHVPATPLTSASPPNLPSVPTSRATRVTSDGGRRRRALRDLAFTSNDDADSLQFLDQPPVDLDHVIERIGDFPIYPGPIVWQAYGEIAFLKCRESFKSSLASSFLA